MLYLPIHLLHHFPYKSSIYAGKYIYIYNYMYMYIYIYMDPIWVRKSKLEGFLTNAMPPWFDA